MSRTFGEELKHRWKHGGMYMRLIFINVAIFIAIRIILAIGALYTSPGEMNPVEGIIYNIFSLHGSISGVLSHPWGLITSIFAHYDFMHILFNMLIFYFISQFFIQFFSNQRMLYTYILGGIFGGLTQILAYAVFPALRGTESFVVGASGAVNAVFMSAAFYRPMMEVRLFGAFRVKMIFIALLFLFMDLAQMSTQDNIAHFAHLGGAIFGILSIRNIDSKWNIVNATQRFIDYLSSLFKGKPKMKVHRGGATRPKKPTSQQTDEEYIKSKKELQEEIDLILDKIARSGYDSLTKREKAILFDQSRK